MQSGYPRAFLLNAYQTAVESADLPYVGHLLINYSVRVKPYLSVLGNFFRPSPSTKDQAAVDDDDDVSRLGERFTWVFPPPGTLPKSEGEGAAAGPMSKRAYREPKSSNSGADNGKPFYLLSERDLQKLMAEMKSGQDSTADVVRPRSNAAAKTPSMVPQAPSRISGGNREKDNGWRELIENTIPTMISLPSSLRGRMQNLARILRPHVILEEDSTISFMGQDGDRIEGSTPITDILLFFTSNAGSRIGRPRELFPLLTHLVERGLGKSPGFNPEKYPALLLREIKRSYRAK